MKCDLEQHAIHPITEYQGHQILIDLRADETLQQVISQTINL
jgi:hypothetical protein